MPAKRKPLSAMTAGDLMTRDVVLLPEEMPLRDAARMLHQAQVSGAPVIDEEGRCVGLLSAADFLRWAEQEGRSAEKVPVPACPYQVKGRLLTGDEAVICTLAEGSCPLQVMRPTIEGRHTALCTLLPLNLRDQQRMIEDLPKDAVRCNMTADIVTAGPRTRLSRLARMMIDAHIHRIIVVDKKRRPLGIVSSTDMLATMAYADGEQ